MIDMISNVIHKFRLTASCPGKSQVFFSVLLAVAGQLALPAAEPTAQPRLIEAIRAASPSRVAELLQVPSELTVRDRQGNSALHWAALSGEAQLVERLLEGGLDPRATNLDGATPLHFGTGDERVTKALLQAGADPNARSLAGCTPLHCAAARPHSYAVVSLLIKAGAQVDAARPVFPAGEVTSLTLAALVNDHRTTSLLLERGAQAGGTNGFTPVAAAAFAGDGQLLKQLVAHGGVVNCDDGFAGHALNIALYGGHRDLVPFLLEHGADLHQTSTFGERVPPIVFSAYTEQADFTVTDLLLKKGADINERSSAGSTALRWAAKRGDTALTTYLLAHGANAQAAKLKSKPVPNREVPSEPASRERAVRDAVQKSIDVLQHSSDTFLANGFVKKSECVSCHQQTIPAVAYGLARERGFRVNEASLAKQLKVQQVAWYKGRSYAYEMREPQPDSPSNLGYGLRGLQALGYQPDAMTEAMVWYLAESQLDDGSWPAYDRRPPLEEGQIVGTALAVHALKLYPQPIRMELEPRMKRARHWLRHVEAKSFNQRVFQLLGLVWAGAPTSEWSSHVRQLLAQQRPDGGWSPLPALESDAWATGVALFALHEAGTLAATAPAYQRGVDFLLRTQFDDGSWFVRSRTWPFQPHFDGEFPHGKDQWISAGATAWAVLALLETLPVSPTREQPPTAQALLAKYEAPSSGTAAAKSDAAKSEAKLVFKRDIFPILDHSCAGCHSGDEAKGGFRVDTVEHLMAGGQSGEPAITPGYGNTSPIVRFVSDQVEDLEMPPVARREKYPPLKPEEIRRICDWVNQGAVETEETKK